jgi:hypothetical protein
VVLVPMAPSRVPRSAAQIVAGVLAIFTGVGALVSFAVWLFTKANADLCTKWYVDPSQPGCVTVHFYHLAALLGVLTFLVATAVLGFIGLYRFRA